MENAERTREDLLEEVATLRRQLAAYKAVPSVSRSQFFQELQAHYRAVTDSFSEAVYIVNSQGQIVFCNAVLGQLTGFTTEELLGRLSTDFYVPEALPVFLERRTQAWSGHPVPPRLETEIYTKAKARVPVELSVTSLRHEGRLMGRIVVVHDITERKQAEDLFRALLEAAPDAMLIVNTEGVIVLANAQAEQLFGFPRHEFLGQPVEIFVPEHLRLRHAAHRQRYYAAPTIRPMGNELELYALRKHGSKFPVEIRLSPLQTAHGLLVSSAIRDITERKRSEEALRQQAALLDLTYDAIMVRDMEDRFVFWNQGAAEQYGWTQEEVLGQTSHALLQTQFPQPLAELQTILLRQGRWEGELVHTTRAGARLVVASRWVLQRDAAGEPAAILETNNDITEYKRLQDHLRQAQKMEAIGTLAGGIAHDFNNLLTPILGLTELAIYKLPATSEAGDYLHEVLTAARHAKDLVQQILAFSRKTRTERQPVKLQVLCQEALTLLRASLPSIIQIQTTLSDEAGTVLADATQIHQVLMNLCANAEYAMRDTGGVLEIRLEPVDVDAALAATHPDLKPGPYARLIIRDTGHGMPPEVLEHIFEPYFTTKPRGEGTGIGLAVVHGIVLSHGGIMVVTSAPGQGTAYTIYFPRLAEAVLDQPTLAEEPLPGGTERILFVDDEPAIITLGQRVLEWLGYQVVACSSSTEALDIFRTASPPFDLVITDQTMPQLTGDALARALRAIRPDLPIILSTGFSRITDAEDPRGVDVDALLIKPWQVDDLAHTIRRVLAQRTHPQP